MKSIEELKRNIEQQRGITPSVQVSRPSIQELHQQVETRRTQPTTPTMPDRNINDLLTTIEARRVSNILPIDRPDEFISRLDNPVQITEFEKIMPEQITETPSVERRVPTREEVFSGVNNFVTGLFGAYEDASLTPVLNAQANAFSELATLPEEQRTLDRLEQITDRNLQTISENYAQAKETSAGRAGEMVGRTSKFLLVRGAPIGQAGSAGSIVASKVNPLSSLIGRSVADKLTQAGLSSGVATAIGSFAKTQVEEYSKDVVLGIPLYINDALQQGLQGRELGEFVLKQTLVDMAFNVGIYFGGAVGKQLKASASTELGVFGDRMAKEIARKAGYTQDEAAAVVKSVFGENFGISGKEFDKVLAEARNLENLRIQDLDPQNAMLKTANRLKEIQDELIEVRRAITEKAGTRPVLKEIDINIKASKESLKEARKSYDLEIKRLQPDLKAGMPTKPTDSKFVVGEKIRMFGEEYQVAKFVDNKYTLVNSAGVESQVPKNFIDDNIIRRGNTGMSSLEVHLTKEVDGLKAKLRQLDTIDESLKEYQQATKEINQSVAAIDLLIDKLPTLSRLEKTRARLFWSNQKNDLLELQYQKRRLRIEEDRLLMDAQNTVMAKLKNLYKNKKANELTPQIERVFNAIEESLDVRAKKIYAPKVLKLQQAEELLNEFKRTNPDMPVSPRLEESISRLSKTRVSDLSIEDIADLNDVLDNLIHINKTQKLAIGSERIQTLMEVQQEIISKNKVPLPLQLDKPIEMSLPEKAFNLYFGQGALDPEQVFLNLAKRSQDTKIYGAYLDVVDGISRKYGMEQAGRRILDQSGFDNFKRMSSEQVQVKLENAETPINLSLGERLSIYLNNKNYKNYAHMTSQRGGIRTATMTETVPLSNNDVRNIMQTLTPEQMKFGDSLTNFFDKFMKNHLNQTSYLMDGVFVARETNYFPIITDKMYRSTHYAKFRATSSSEAFSFLNQRTSAEAPIMVLDAFDIVDKWLVNASHYYGMAAPVRNLKMIMGNADVKRTINQAYGGRLDDVVDHWFKNLDMANYTSSVNEEAIGKIITNYQTAVLGANPRVWFNQLASIPNATAEIEPRFLIKAISEGRLGQDEIMERYSSVIWKRGQGFVTREAGEVAQRAGRLSQASVRPITEFDRRAIKSIWGAVEEKMDAAIDGGFLKIAKNGDDYYRAVASETERIIRRSQPNYNDWFRSMAGSQRNVLGRVTTAFTTQRNKNFNMVYSAFADFQATGDARPLLRTIPAVIGGAATIAALDTAQRTLRRRELDFAGSLQRSFVSNIYLVGDVYDKLSSGYDVDNLAESAINDFLGAVSNVTDQDKSFGHRMYGLTESTAKLMGLPLQNVRNVFGDMLNAMEIAGVSNGILRWEYDKMFREPRRSDIYREFNRALDQEDFDYVMHLIGDMQERGVTYEALRSSMRNYDKDEGYIRRFKRFLD